MIHMHIVENRIVRIAVLAFLLNLSIVGSGWSAVYMGDPTNYRDLIPNLKAGDTLQLAAGTYDRGLPLSDLHGNDEVSRIIVTGPESGDPAIFIGRSCCNTVTISNTSYLTISHLTVDGQRIPYIDAINATGVNHHITLEYLRILNHGGDGTDPNQQLTNGLSMFGPGWDWVIRHNYIEGAGTGMYIGNYQGIGRPFVGGLVEYNVIIDTLGYNIQFKKMNDRLDANGNVIPGMPTEDHKTIIRHNVFSKAHNAQDGSWARPALLVDHFPLTGEGSNDIYEIYGNFFYQDSADALFQGTGNIVLYNNVFVNDNGMAINITWHDNIKSRKTIVFNNTVVANGTGIKVANIEDGYTPYVAGNAVFANTPLSVVGTAEYNITDSYANAALYLANPNGDIGALDLYPISGKLNGVTFDRTLFESFTDWNLDFNGDVNDGTMRGAYAGQGQNPGWTLAMSTKPSSGESQNAAPTSSAGTDITVESGGSVTLTGSGSDSDGVIASYAWSQTGGPAVNMQASGTSINFLAPVVATTTQLTFRLTVTDDRGATSSDTVVVMVNPTPTNGGGGGGSGGQTGGTGDSGDAGGGGTGFLEILVLASVITWVRRRETA